MLRCVFIGECSIARFLCAMCVFEVRASSLGYLCVKFWFFRGLRCWASPWRKTAYSITHSISLFDAPGTEAKTNLTATEVQHNKNQNNSATSKCPMKQTILVPYDNFIRRNVEQTSQKQQLMITKHYMNICRWTVTAVTLKMYTSCLLFICSSHNTNRH